MLNDTLFHTRSGGLKKAALLLNIPCAILPMLIALGSFLSLPEGWAYFKYDAGVAGVVYAMYLYGLLLSRQFHRNSWPLVAFFLHASFIVAHQYLYAQEWTGYAAVVTLIGTSLINQYHRMGSLECLECGA